jgi:hypothetical protein
MIVGVLLNHVMDALGLIYVINITIKMSRGYPVRRWFF